jgi:RNA polymerase sigma-70 factor (ECF subfamily)
MRREVRFRVPIRRRRATSRRVPDEEFMRQYADGKAGAFAELFRRYERRAFSYFVKRTLSSARAQDLYQYLVLRVNRARDLYEPSRAFDPWFFQIARHLLLDNQRLAYRTREVGMAHLESCSDRAESSGHDGDREAVRRLLAGLSAEERYVVYSAKVAGLTFPELATEIGGAWMLGTAAGSYLGVVSGIGTRLLLEGR